MNTMTQYFLISVQALCTTDDTDLVTKWSIIVAEKDLPNLSMGEAGKLSLLPLKDLPEGMTYRPMTGDEIRTYREGHTPLDSEGG